MTVIRDTLGPPAKHQGFKDTLEIPKTSLPILSYTTCHPERVTIRDTLGIPQTMLVISDMLGHRERIRDFGLRRPTRIAAPPPGQGSKRGRRGETVFRVPLPRS